MKTNKIVAFASGSGSNFKAIHQSVLKKELPAEISFLISDNPRAGALDYARRHSIPAVLISPSDYSDNASYENRLLELLGEAKPDLIVLAGYLKKIPDVIVDRYPRKIINIHPALLPKYGGKGFYGMRVHRAVIKNKEKESGCTVHFVNKYYDEGPIIAQVRVLVREDDTAESLAKKILKQEHMLYPKVIRFLLSHT